MGERLNPDFPNCWLYNIHSVVIWYVVIVVQVCLYGAMQNFLKLRQKWLENLPNPQATTLLVEDIPVEYRSDKALEALLNETIGKGKVEACHVVKNVPTLTKKWAELQEARENLKKA